MSILVLLGGCSPGLSDNQSALPSSSAQGSAPASTTASVAPKSKIRIGSDGSYESELMGEIYSQVLENAGYDVERTFGRGSRQEPIVVMDTGDIDLIAVYVGSGLGFFDEELITGDGEANATALQEALRSKGTTILGITSGENTNAFVVRADTSDSLGLTKMSQLGAVQDQFKWGLPSDCATNLRCENALEEYGITYPPKQLETLSACDPSMATALESKAIDVAVLCSSQPAIAQFGFVILEDELDTQPAENIAPLVRDDYLATVDAAAFQGLLDAASAKISTEELRKLGVLIDVEKQDIEDVARDWLTQQDLLT